MTGVASTAPVTSRCSAVLPVCLEVVFGALASDEREQLAATAEHDRRPPIAGEEPDHVERQERHR